MHVRSLIASCALLGVGAISLAAQGGVEEIYGTWRIQRVLPTPHVGCWDVKRGETLVGTTLSYAPHRMRWHGGWFPVTEILSREVTAEEFRRENSADGSTLKLSDVGVRRDSVTEFDLQHDDADITGATTEVPGDTILVTGRNTIVVSACGVYFEAVRVGSKTQAGRAAGR